MNADRCSVLSEDDLKLLAESRRVSKERAEAFVAATPAELNTRDDQIAAVLSRENSSAKSKLSKVYRLQDEASSIAAPFVACRRGCSACCRMNVSVTSIEAERLSDITGRQARKLTRPVQHHLEKFSGVDCPFLVDESCSVYEYRPFACRAHLSFDLTAYWCQPQRSNVSGMGMAKMGGAQLAYASIASSTLLRGFADIRDFFPPIRTG